MKSEFRNAFADEEGHAALEWTTQGTSNGDSVSYAGVSILEIEGGKVRRFMADVDTRALTPQVVDCWRRGSCSSRSVAVPRFVLHSLFLSDC